tara:strand:+ start:1460 stop:1699 length:240 start_codon:yes stop_codon:yes gene_type:complete
MKKREINIQTGEETILDLTAEEVSAKEAREVEVQAERNHYTTKRRKEYPTWQDQLDDIYHNGLDAWKATIKVIKDKYPK